MNCKLLLAAFLLCLMQSCQQETPKPSTKPSTVSNKKQNIILNNCDITLMDTIDYKHLFFTYRLDNTLIACIDSLPIEKMPYKDQVPEHKQVFGDKRFSIFVRRESGGLIHDKAENLWLPYYAMFQGHIYIWILDDQFYPAFTFRLGEYKDEFRVDPPDSLYLNMYIYGKARADMLLISRYISNKINNRQIDPKKNYADLLILIKYLQTKFVYKPKKGDIDNGKDVHMESYGITWYAPEFR